MHLRRQVSGMIGCEVTIQQPPLVDYEETKLQLHLVDYEETKLQLHLVGCEGTRLKPPLVDSEEIIHLAHHRLVYCLLLLAVHMLGSL